MKYTPSAETGFLPRIANRMLMVTMVRAIAISGEIRAMVVDPSARFSSTNCMERLPLGQTASAHQQAELFTIGLPRRQRLRQPPVKHHGDAVGDLGEFIE